MSGNGEYIFPNLISLNVVGGPMFGFYSSEAVKLGLMHSRVLKNN
jgi:hypothetical protein